MTLAAAAALLCAGGTGGAATLTWNGGGDGHSWNGAGNWTGGTRPGTHDTLHITTAGTIDNVYRDAGTATYDGGSTWRGFVNLNQGTINMTAHFGSGDNGVFNIGDGLGTADATVNVSNAGWRFDRHGNGTYTVNIKQDGRLIGGTYLNYGGHGGRKFVINVDGGLMTSPNAWNMSDGAGSDANRVNLTNGGTVNVGAITVHEEIIDFADTSASSFTANYGASFADIAAVDAALGTRFTASGGGTLRTTDNGGDFTVDLLAADGTLTWDGAGDGNWGASRWNTPPPNFPDDTIAAVIDTSNKVTVAADRSAFSVAASNGGQVDIGPGNTLTVVTDVSADSTTTLGAGSKLVTDTGTLAGVSNTSGGTATIDTSGNVGASHLSLATSGSTLVKEGAGKLSFSQASGTNSLAADTTVQVNAGELAMQAASNPMGSGDLVLNGGTFTVTGPRTEIPNELNFGFYAGAAANNLPNIDDGADNDRNGGLFDLTPTTSSAWTGEIWPGGKGDNYCQMWSGKFKAPSTGTYEFYVHGDDYELLWIDTGQDGDFEAGSDDISRNVEGEEGWNTPHTETVSLTGGQSYAFAIAHREGGGGDWMQITIKKPAGSAERINPSAAGQSGWWSSEGVLAVDMSDTDVLVTADSTLNAVTPSTAAFGGLTLQNGILKTQGAGEGMSFSGTTIAAPNTVGFDTEVETKPGVIDGGGHAATIVKKGKAALILEGNGTNLGSAEFQVKEGRLEVPYASDPTGGAGITLQGGTLAVTGATTSTPVANAAVAHYAFDNAGNLGLDSSPKGNHLNNSGDPSYNATGKVGGAVDLDGNDMLQQGGTFPTGVPTGGNAYTIAGWFNPDNGGARGLVGWGNYGSGSQVNALRMDGNDKIHNYWWSNDLNSGGVGDLRPGTTPAGWHHVVATYDPTLGSNQHKLFIDGVLRNQRNASGLNAQPLNFAVGKTTGNEYFDGLLDELSILDRGVTAAEVTSLMNTGTLSGYAAINIQNTITVDNVMGDGLVHTGYHVTPDAGMNLDNNGGLMSMTPYGTAVLTDGPGGRGLDFNDDNDFINTGAIGQGDNYMNLWKGMLHVAPGEAGVWGFRNAGDDDRAGIWLDLDQDGVFESSTPGLGSNRGEQLSWEDGGNKNVTLAAGDYMIGFTHGEYTGGSRADFRFTAPGGSEVIVKPSDPAQDGLWTFMPTSTLELTTDFNANLKELVLKNGDLLVTGANLLTVEQASISTATSGTVGLITDTDIILTDQQGFDGNGQTVVIAKKGAGDLILNKGGTGLGNATFDVRQGRLIGVHASNPFGDGVDGATLKLNGGEIVLASATVGASVTFANDVTVSADGTITAGNGGVAAGGNATVTLGGMGNVVTVEAEKTLTLRSQDGYALDVASGFHSGNVTVSEGTVALTGGGTVAKLEVTGGVASSTGTMVSEKLTLGDLKVDANGGTSFGVSGADLLNPTAAQHRTISLSGSNATLRGAGGTPAGAQLWLDASDIDADGNPDSIANGALISRWYDKSGYGRDASDRGGDPNYVASGPNGKPAVNFDGNDWIAITHDFRPEDYTIITVARYTGGDSERVISSRDGRNWLFGFHGRQDERWYADGWIHTTGAENTNWHLHAGTMDGPGDPKASFWKDGTLLTSNDTGSSNSSYWPQRIELGGWKGGSEVSKSEVAEVFFFDRVLSADELNDIGGYLAEKYGMIGTGYTGGFDAPINMPFTDIAVAAGSPSTLTLLTEQTAVLGDLIVDMSGFLPGDMILEILSDATALSFEDLILTGPIEPGEYLLVEWTGGGSLDPADLFRGEVQAGDLRLEPGQLWISPVQPGDIPEPATMAMLTLALAGLGGYVRRRRRA